MQVKTVKDAWDLANRLFPTDYELDEQASKNAGYSIYTSTGEGVNAWISSLNDRLELNHPDGRSENIWIEELQPKDTVAIVGVYGERTVFGEVKVNEVREITYHYVQGIVNKTLDDGRFGVEITTKDPVDSVTSFGCENVAYIRFA